MPRIALIYDDQPRPETTGVYCLRALRQLGEVEHFLPQQADRIPRQGFDLYLCIDDGLRYRLPAELRPSAWWVIDTHLDAAWAEEKGRDFDWLFAAQLDGAERLCNAGLPAVWLPLACDPAIHRPHSLPKRWDIGFVGRVSPGPRQELLEFISREFPDSFVGQAYFDELAKIYSQARIGFNRSVKNDVNMRVFETLGCGTLLLTNDLRDNRQDELLIPDRHLVTYGGNEELLDKLRFYLAHAEIRDQIAQAGHAEVLARHTYLHRMKSLLETVRPQVEAASCRLPAQQNAFSSMGQAPCADPPANESAFPKELQLLSATSTAAASAPEGLDEPCTAEPIVDDSVRLAGSTPAALLDEVDFIIKTFLRPQALLRLLHSILEFYPEAHVTIADDGKIRESTDADSRACCELIDSKERFVLHSLPFAAGVTPGRNLLVDKTHRPFVLLLDDDFCFTAETTIARFMERLASDPQVGLVAGACIDVVGDDRRLRNSGGTLRVDAETLVIDSTGWRDRENGLRDYVPQFALIRREVFRDVRWDGSIGAEHYDFCLQLQRSHWQVAQDVSVRIDHHHFSEALPGYAEHRFNYAAAQQWLLRKWNLRQIVQDGKTIVEASQGEAQREDPAFSCEAQPSACTNGASPTVSAASLPDKSEISNPKSEMPVPSSILHPPSSPLSPRLIPVKSPSYFDHARPEIAALVPTTVSRILDIGCASGRLGKLLKDRQNAEVVGIELQPEAAALARQRLDQVLELDIEDREFDFPAGRFDCIVCADILEHVRDPAQLLAKISRWLAPDGVLVASIPNVRHHSVVSSLLAGNWTYESAGLLDSDHVRFFTRREIEKLLFRQGFEIEILQAKPGPGYDEWNQAGRPGEVRIGSLSIAGMTSEDAQEFFTYQYLVVARHDVEAASCRLPAPRNATSPPAPAREAQLQTVRSQAELGNEEIEKLARDFPWPAEKPSVPIPTEKLGWFKEPQQELMRRELNAETKLVVELGAWLGLSTRFIADQAPHARVITIDHWQGSSEHRKDPTCAAMLPTLFETFTALNWEYRDRILPLKMNGHEGLQTIARYGLKPDVIFVDADHSYEAVSADLKLSRQLFPQARLIGDDYDSPDVQRAVDEFAATHGFEVEPVGTDWRSWRLHSRAAPVLRPKVVPGLTSIIIVTHNQLGYTKECIDSIELRTDEPYELIFIDNGSTDGTVEYLRSIAHTVSPSPSVRSVDFSPHVNSSSTRGLQSTLLENPDNRGFPAAVNQGLQIARGECVILLNNDTVVTTGWLRRMRDVLESDPKIGLVGPCSNCVSGAQMVPAGYQDMASLDGFAWDWAKRHQGVIEDTDRLIGFCLAMKRALIDEIGVFDERFGIGCFEDDDFCRRAIQAGWRAVIARDAFIHHYGNRTFQGSGIDLGHVLDVNRQKFLDKWASPSSPPLSKGGPGGVALSNSASSSAPAQPLVQAASCRLPTSQNATFSAGETRASTRSQAPLGNEACRNSASLPLSDLDPPSSILHPRPSNIQRFHLTSSPTGGLLLQPNHVRLSVCLIVRDNETTIGAALESIRPYVDEIVVVDTGSKDRTPEICRQYGVRPFEFPWCDDFSAARNESLEHAQGEWLFWMDSDDTISPECGRQLRELADGPHADNVLGYVMQVHCPGPGPDGRHDVTIVDHVKLIRNRPELRFEGRIHEQLLPAIRRAGGDVAWTDIHVVHSGSDHSPAGWQRKLERDLRILHLELADTPNHPFVLFNLGMTYADAASHSNAPKSPGARERNEGCDEEDGGSRMEDRENSAVGRAGSGLHDAQSSILHPRPSRQTRNDLYDRAIHYLQRCLAASVPEESHVRKAFALLVSTLSQAERHDEAWTACRNGLSLYPDDKELLFRSAMLHHHFGRLRHAEEAYLRVLNGHEERHFSSIDHGLASYKARFNLAIVYEDMGRFSNAEAEWRQIVRDVPDYSPARRGLEENLTRQGKLAAAARLLNA